MVSVLPLTSSSISLFSRFLSTVPRAPTTIGITVTFMIHNFFELSVKVQIFVAFFAFFYFSLCGSLERQNPLDGRLFSSYYLTVDRVFWSGVSDPFLSQIPRELLLLLFFTTLKVFHTDDFHRGLNDSKSPQVSRTLLSILVNLNSAVVWMVSTHVLISDSSTPFTNPLVTQPSASITIGIAVTFMFRSCFSSPARSRNISFLSPSFNFSLLYARTAKFTIRHVLLFC